jgi:hypothetical protein
MGDIIIPSSLKNASYYKLQVGTKSLKLSVFETENVIHLYIGGPSLYCIYATIHTEQSLFVSHGIHDKSVGTLEQIYYNKSCSLEHNFVRGVDTNMIIKVLITYIKRTYKYVRTLQFNDASTRTCNNSIPVSLASMTYLYSGSTWYQKNFNAYLSDDYSSRFASLVQAYNERKLQYTWEMFRDLYAKGPLPLSEDELTGLFSQAPTWQYFFASIVEQIGISEFCNFVSPWLTNFMRQVMKHDIILFPYLLNLDNFKNIQYTITPYTNVGGCRRKFTRKTQRKIPQNEL